MRGQPIYRRDKKMPAYQEQCKKKKKCPFGTAISGGLCCNYLSVMGHSRGCHPSGCDLATRKKEYKRRHKAYKQEAVNM